MCVRKIVLASISFLIVGVFISMELGRNRIPQVVLDGKTFFVEVADTNEARTKGLSGHVPLLDEQGMLFVFDHPDIYGFWMKDMLFPIDIIWIDANERVVHIEESVLPQTFPKIFRSTQPAKWVLEVLSGEAQKIGLKVGDSTNIFYFF